MYVKLHQKIFVKNYISATNDTKNNIIYKE